MYALHLHPEAIHRAGDDDREYEILCELHKLRAEAARRVPEWTPEMRRDLRRMARDVQHGPKKGEGYWGPKWYD